MTDHRNYRAQQPETVRDSPTDDFFWFRGFQVPTTVVDLVIQKWNKSLDQSF